MRARKIPKKETFMNILAISTTLLLSTLINWWESQLINRRLQNDLVPINLEKTL